MNNKTDNNENFRLKRNVLKKILISLIILLLIVAGTLLILLIINQGKTSKDNNTICDTSDCVKASAFILNHIDPSIDPCENFYNFACGNFMKTSLITNEVSSYQKLDRIVKAQINEIITNDFNNNNNGNTSLILQQQRKFYKSCIDIERIEQTYNETILDLLEYLGGWPVLKNRFWNENHFHWLNSTIKCRKFGLPFEHFISVSTDQTNGFTGLSILKPSLRPQILNESYIDLMTDISIQFGASPTYARIESIKIYHFQKELYLLIKHTTNKTDITLKELMEKTGIPWLKFLKDLSDNILELNETTSVIVDSLYYFENLNGFLSRYPKRVQANYFIWRIIESYVNMLGENIRERYQKFLIDVNNREESSETREEFCLRKSREFFSGVAEIEYVRKFTTPEMKRDIQIIIDKIKIQLIRLIRQNDWMDDTTKVEAENRLNRIEIFIGWSEKVFNEDIAKSTLLDNFELLSDNLIEMMSMMNIRDFDNVLLMINKNFTQLAGDIWRSIPILDVNAYYSPQLQTLVLPSSILQGQFYDITHPKSMNYAGIGSIVGHELTHALVVENPHFNRSQIRRWWPDEIDAIFVNKSKCFIEQYENFTDNFGKFSDNGTIAFEEIYPDFLGIKLAYRAYNEWRVENGGGGGGGEFELPGLNYSSNQIFWITLSTIRCYQMKLILDSDRIHGLPTFSVIGSLRNLPDFAVDYRCPIDSNMNPREKCKIF